MYITPTQWQIEIPDAIAQTAWRKSKVCPTPQAQWNTYLNQLSCDVLLPLLQDYLPTATRYPDGIATIWEVVSGTGLQGPVKRMVLVPDKNIDRELSVPQEWVDSPEWAGDYYLAVQINPDEQSLTVWGYATHTMLKAGAYHAADRTYHLEADQVIQDLNVLWVTQQMNFQEVTQGAIAPIQPIATAENLLQRLARSPRPRLEIPFVQWMACLHQPDWRRRLSALRRGEPPKVNHLSQWFQNIFEAGWAVIDNPLIYEAPALRQNSAIDAPIIRRVKALQLHDRSLFLMMTVEPTPDGRLEVQVQVRSRDEETRLPLGLIVTLQSSSGETIQMVQALPEDLAVQLQRFRSNTGTPFLVQVEWDGDRAEELFMV
ncbi:MAG: DUF1822 family protein [Alkalinema sp. RU_4_3]|nr:DUF1822 family protein [Alkalinema sp. RU_4_3]